MIEQLCKHLEIWLKVCNVLLISLLLCFIVECNVITRVTAAPTGDKPLTPNDVGKVLEEILEAKNQSRYLGLKLNIPEHEVTGIHKQYTDPMDRLYHVLVEVLKQVDPRPTWRAIIDALRSPLVNLPQLALRVERAHFPDPTATRDLPPETPAPTGI